MTIRSTERIALFTGLLTPAFVACSTNMGGGGGVRRSGNEATERKRD